MYKIAAKNVFEDICQLFVLINYPEDSKYDSNANNLVVDKVKDETCIALIKGFA